MKFTSAAAIIFALSSFASAASPTTSVASATITPSVPPPACVLACVAQVSREQNCPGMADVSCVGEAHAAQVEACLNQICPNGLAPKAIKAFHASYSAYTAIIKTTHVQ